MDSDESNVSEEPDYYAVLGVSRGCEPKEITRMFRILAMQYHPDKNSATSVEFQKILQAYEILKNPETRRQYDEDGLVCAASSGPSFQSEDIDSFARTYPNSAAELEDLIEFYNKKAGLIDDVFDYMPLSEPSLAQLERFVAMLQSEFTAGRLERKLGFDESVRKMRRKLRTTSKAASGVRKTGKKNKASSNLESLSVLIKKNQARRNGF